MGWRKEGPAYLRRGSETCWIRLVQACTYWQWSEPTTQTSRAVKSKYVNSRKGASTDVTIGRGCSDYIKAVNEVVGDKPYEKQLLWNAVLNREKSESSDILSVSLQGNTALLEMAWDLTHDKPKELEIRHPDKIGTRYCLIVERLNAGYRRNPDDTQTTTDDRKSRK